MVGICERVLVRTADDLKILANECCVTNTLEAPIGTPTRLVATSSTCELRVVETALLRRTQVLLQTLAREMTAGRRSATAVTVDTPSEGMSTDCNLRLRYSRLKPFRLGFDKPFLHLDGTGDIAIARKIFGTALTHRHYRVERNAKVTQVLGRNFSKQSICGAQSYFSNVDDEEAAKLRAELKAVVARMNDPAVIASKAVISALGLASDPRARHFGALRGVNSLEACLKVLVIGREQPFSQDIDRIARAFASEDGQTYKSGEYISERRALRLRYGAKEIDVLRHPDSWGDLILRQIREAEIEQAIDRIRLIHNEHAKEVILLTPVVLDITVDRLIKWIYFQKGGTRIERAFESKGFLPLSSRECVRLLPKLWGNAETAATDLRDVGLKKGMVLEDMEAQLPQSNHVCHISYRRDQKGARQYEGLVCVPRDAVREAVEALTGPLKDLNIISQVYTPGA